MDKGTKPRRLQTVPRGFIHITGGLNVPADTGCHIWPNCLTCPLPKCYMDMTLSEKNYFTRQRKKITAEKEKEICLYAKS